ncbi:MAG: large repetitive protein, partial [Candidatus Cloacimonadota bacterium]|nr:large repetitive protein [Candidatus Cloacimonadota bacterium]
MVNRPMDTDWYSSSDKFRTQSGADNRARNFYSDSTECDPTAPVEGSTTAIYPMTTFVVIPGGVGDISGTVTGDNDEPLADVTVTVNGRPYSTTTDDNGEFFIANVLPGDYVVSFSKYTYISQTVNITLEEDETEIMNISMELMPQVSVTGTILASDTGLGIAGANIHLIGYADYSMSSVADGSFSNSEVFANQSYEYIISASGYTSTSGTITVGNTDYDMGTITLTEIAYAPNSVEAELNDSYNAVNISWNAPDPNAMEITESFEATAFPPQDWTQSITNDGPANTLGIYPTWCNFGTITIAGSGDVSPTEGIKQAGLWWDYSHQDEWLITPSFNCPPDAHLSFDTYLHMGSPNNDHYYVKVSTNEGSSWNILWDGAAQPEALNNYDYLITVGLEEYGGMQVQLAFHADDPPSNEGLWFPWFIDNVYIGNFVDRIEFEPTPALTDIRDIAQKAKSDQHTPDQPARTYLSGQNALSHTGSKAPDKNIILPASRSSHRSLEGYQVWRLISGQEQNENNWVSLTDEIISNLNFTDESWNTLANGTYRWAVKAIYTADVSSVPAFSNPLVKEVVSGNIVGFVRKENGQGIPNATVTASGGFSANTNSAGAYSLTVPAGVYTVTASAASYDSLSYENITVAPSQNTTLNFILEPTSNGDELIPVTVTALNPNYPNPFNPETTISYDIKEAGEVRLDIYNLKGQLVRTLVDKAQVPGRYRIVFDSRDNKGNPLSSGIYLYRLQTKDYQSTRKMMLMQ